MFHRVDCDKWGVAAWWIEINIARSAKAALHTLACFMQTLPFHANISESIQHPAPSARHICAIGPHKEDGPASAKPRRGLAGCVFTCVHMRSRCPSSLQGSWPTDDVEHGGIMSNVGGFALLGTRPPHNSRELGYVISFYPAGPDAHFGCRLQSESFAQELSVNDMLNKDDI